MAHHYAECLAPRTVQRSYWNHAARRLAGRFQVAMICGPYRSHATWRTVRTRNRYRRRRRNDTPRLPWLISAGLVSGVAVNVKHMKDVKRMKSKRSLVVWVSVGVE
jgi:hypothetical protein